MACIELDAGAAYSVLVRRNNSLTPATRLLAFGGILLTCAFIGTVFAVCGVWAVLPFTGIEITALALAFSWVERHATDYERLTLRDQALEIEIGSAKRVERCVFNLCWAQVGMRGARLAVREGGREFAIGRLMTAGERVQVARTLRRHAALAR